MDESFVVQIRRSGGVTDISRTGQLRLVVPPHGTDEAYWYRLAVEIREELRSLPRESTTSFTRDAVVWNLSFDTENFEVPNSKLSLEAKTLAEHVLNVASLKPQKPRFGDQ